VRHTVWAADSRSIWLTGGFGCSLRSGVARGGLARGGLARGFDRGYGWSIGRAVRRSFRWGIGCTIGWGIR